MHCHYIACARIFLVSVDRDNATRQEIVGTRTERQLFPKRDTSTFFLEYPPPPSFQYLFSMPLPTVLTDFSLLESTGRPESMTGLSTPICPGPTPDTNPLVIHPTRHEEFWLYDGSIVLAVENTLFRVHQTILANHSEVFADLFTVPQPENEDTIDGCHVVHLYDDEKDFVDLLKAMYHPE